MKQAKSIHVEHLNRCVERIVATRQAAGIITKQQLEEGDEGAEQFRTQAHSAEPER